MASDDSVQQQLAAAIREAARRETTRHEAAERIKARAEASRHEAAEGAEARAEAYWHEAAERAEARAEAYRRKAADWDVPFEFPPDSSQSSFANQQDAVAEARNMTTIDELSTLKQKSLAHNLRESREEKIRAWSPSKSSSFDSSEHEILDHEKSVPSDPNYGNTGFSASRSFYSAQGVSDETATESNNSQDSTFDMTTPESPSDNPSSSNASDSPLSVRLESRGGLTVSVASKLDQEFLERADRLVVSGRKSLETYPPHRIFRLFRRDSSWQR